MIFSTAFLEKEKSDDSLSNDADSVKSSQSSNSGSSNIENIIAFDNNKSAKIDSDNDLNILNDINQKKDLSDSSFSLRESHIFNKDLIKDLNSPHNTYSMTSIICNDKKDESISFDKEKKILLSDFSKVKIVNPTTGQNGNNLNKNPQNIIQDTHKFNNTNNNESKDSSFSKESYQLTKMKNYIAKDFFLKKMTNEEINIVNKTQNIVLNTSDYYNSGLIQVNKVNECLENKIESRFEPNNIFEKDINRAKIANQNNNDQIKIENNSLKNQGIQFSNIPEKTGMMGIQKNLENYSKFQSTSYQNYMNIPYNFHNQGMQTNFTNLKQNNIINRYNSNEIFNTELRNIGFNNNNFNQYYYPQQIQNNFTQNPRYQYNTYYNNKMNDNYAVHQKNQNLLPNENIYGKPKNNDNIFQPQNAQNQFENRNNYNNLNNKNTNKNKENQNNSEYQVNSQSINLNQNPNIKKSEEVQSQTNSTIKLNKQKDDKKLQKTSEIKQPIVPEKKNEKDTPIQISNDSKKENELNNLNDKIGEKNLNELSFENEDPKFKELRKKKKKLKKKAKKLILNLQKCSDKELGELALSLSKEQVGCRFLQKKIEENSNFADELLFPVLKNHFLELISDNFGNYLLQKLIENIKETNLVEFIDIIKIEIFEVSRNPHGTRVIQRLVELLRTQELRNKFIMNIKDNLINFTKDTNANHVIQKFIINYNQELPILVEYFKDNFTEISLDKFGCCVMQKLIENCNEQQKSLITEKIVDNALTLMKDQYGNYVIQFVISQKNNDVNSKIFSKLKSNLIELSQQKFSSNVIEKILEHSNQTVQDTMIKEFLNENIFPNLLLNHYGNYVIQRAFYVCKQKNLFNELIKSFKSNLEELKKLTFGLKLYTKLVNLYPELDENYIDSKQKD